MYFGCSRGRVCINPKIAPHWVETVGSRSISYTFVYETPDGRMRSRVRSFNAYLRRLHLDPARPGERPARDAVKAAAMAAAIPVRRQIGKAGAIGFALLERDFTHSVSAFAAVKGVELVRSARCLKFWKVREPTWSLTAGR